MGGLVLVTFIPTYYAIDLGLGLGLVGAVFVFGRLLDVITDPLIGYLSDETRTHLGPRRPWVILSTPLFCFAALMLFVPPETASLTYLIIASGAYFLFYTALDVPFSCIGLEISPFVHERSVLASTKGIFQVLGALIAALIPIVFSLTTRPSLILTTQVLFGLSVFGLVIFLLFVPHRERAITVPRLGFITTLKLTWSSRPYRFLIGSFLIAQSSTALTAALTVLYVTHIIERPTLIGLFLGLVLISSALFLPVWVWISKRKSKKSAWLISIALCCLLLAVVPFFGKDDIVIFAIFCMLIGGCYGCDAIMPTSMLADIVYSEERDGKSRLAGLYLAMKNSVSKLTFIVPMGLAFPILELSGFISGSANTDRTLFVLIFFYALLPIALKTIAFFIVWKMPRTEFLRASAHD